MLRCILVALSGTPFTPIAVRRAVGLAQKHGARLTGVTVVDIERLKDVGPVPLGGASTAKNLAEHRVAITQERVEAEIAGFEKACRDASVPHVVSRERGDAFEMLMGLWRYHDLTVIGLRGLFEYGVVHNPDDHVVKLIRRGVRPIIAVSSEYREVNRVLVAYDGSRHAAMAMKRFAELVLWPGATVRLVCFGFEDEEATPLLADATSYLRAHGYEPEAQSMPGDAKPGLLAHAQEWGADLVVMGSTYRSRIRKVVMGPTTQEALMHAGMPLFLSQ
jgi:nucleotide-binding universal stress UspA family protein